MTAAVHLASSHRAEPRKKVITAADLFCGAGGSSTGLFRALRKLGIDLRLTAVNHWPVAVDTHKLNHPNAIHFCQDLAKVRPLAAVPGGRLDVLFASPTCTHHSKARGGRPTSDQQRQDPEHVTAWLTQLQVDWVVVENVPEFVDWGPVNPRTGKPIKSKKGLYFQAWIKNLEAIGYRVEFRILNCANYGVATTRERFFLVARRLDRESQREKVRVPWPEATHAEDVGEALLPGIGALRKWKAARGSINWKKKGRSIFGRKKPLSLKSVTRIIAGAIKHSWPWPYLARLADHVRTHPARVDASNPDLLPSEIGKSKKAKLRGEKKAARRRKHWQQTLKLLAECDRRVAAAGGAGVGTSVAAQSFLLAPASGGAPRSVDLPTPSVVAGAGAITHQLVEAKPPEPMVLGQQSCAQALPVSGPLPTIATAGAVALIDPLPAPVELIGPYYGSGSGLTCKSVETPLDSIPTKGRFGLVIPIAHKWNGAAGAQSVDQPLRSIVPGHGGELAIVMPVTHDDAADRSRSAGEPLPVITGANRGELGFITASFGEREGQAPRVHSLDAPLPAIPATGSVRFVHGVDVNGYDVLFRMLTPPELAHASSFDDEETYIFTGTLTEQVKQIGNAVPPGMAEALVHAIAMEAWA